jgi:hypothetical protein
MKDPVLLIKAKPFAAGNQSGKGPSDQTQLKAVC